MRLGIIFNVVLIKNILTLIITILRVEKPFSYVVTLTSHSWILSDDPYKIITITMFSALNHTMLTQTTPPGGSH